jgi:glycosyltransferase involved in cell wall biosynthesis
MHILVANNLYPPIIAGGAERIVAYLCEGLVARGHRVTVVSTCGPEMEPYPTETRNGVDVIRFFPPNVYWSFDRSREPGARKILWHARDAWNHAAGRTFAEILKTVRPDILHTHLIDGFSAAIWGAARRADIPVIHTAHDYHLLCPRAFMLTRALHICANPQLKCRLFRRWHLRTTRHVNLFASPSQFLLDMHEAAGLQAEAAAVVHNGIPPAEIAPHRGPKTPADPVRYLMMSRLTVEKGVEVLLDAMTQVPATSPQIEVTIAGTGPLEERVKAAAAHDPRLRFAGFLDGQAKANALAQADFLLLPSLWYENAPVTIIEAAGHQMGVIASDIGAIPEFVANGRTGLLFPPGDAAGLADAIRRSSANPGILPDLATHAIAVAERFSLERMIETYENHYLKLEAAAGRARSAA